ncbi:MAG: glycosyl hydrolase 53 family protein [Bacteroidales bacterium]|nr:glycosyl hydrolase 53 family protein [Bacteroidales bacterium]
MKRYISIFVLALLGFTAQASASTLGDIDGNGQVNVSDVTALVNKILGVASYDDARCDVNADGQVNVSDVTTLVNIILGTYEDPNQRFAGADISLLERYEERGALYYDKSGSRVTDMLAFYKQIGLNAMRVRLFVDPSKAPAADKGTGVFQDLAYVGTLGKRIKEHGLKFILDFHYSDSWADPGKQTVPARWKGLTPAVMADSVYRYTKESLQALVAAGAKPDMVQVGNEITYGMLWDSGSVWPEGTANKGTWENFSAYFNAGARAVREVLPAAKIICHIEMANNSNPAKFFGVGAKNFSLDYDIMGLSYYPAYHAKAATIISALEGVVKQLKVQVPDRPIMIMETGYSYRWEMSGTKDATISSKYAYTEAGQAKFTTDLIAMLKKYEQVKGLFWWCAEQNEYGLDWNTQRVVDNWWQASLVDNQNGHILQATYELPTFIK